MELTRRDALGALAAAGVVGGGAVAYEAANPFGDGSGPDHDPVETLRAVAEVVYPSELDGVGEFVETYVAGRATDRPGYRSGVTAATGKLEELGREWYDAPVADLSPGDRDALLRDVGADTAPPDPEGTDAQRIRFFVVNELLYALYTSPTGGRLVGIENPQGHPGGIETYQRGGTGE